MHSKWRTLLSALLLLAMLLQFPVAARADADPTPLGIAVSREGMTCWLPVVSVNGGVYADAGALAQLAGCEVTEDAQKDQIIFYRQSPLVVLYRDQLSGLPLIDGRRYVLLGTGTVALGLKFSPYQSGQGFYVTVLKTPADLLRKLDEIFLKSNYHLWEVPAELGLGWEVAEFNARLWAVLPFVGSGSLPGLLSGKDEQERYDRALASVLNAHGETVALTCDLSDMDKTLKKAGKYLARSKRGLSAAQHWIESNQKTRRALEDAGAYDLVHAMLGTESNPYEEGPESFFEGYPALANALNFNYWLDSFSFMSAVADGEEAMVRVLGNLFMNSGNVYLSRSATKMLDQKFHSGGLAVTNLYGGYVFSFAMDQLDDHVEDVMFGAWAPFASTGAKMIKTATEWVFQSPDIGDISDATIYYSIYSEIAMELSDAYFARKGNMAPGVGEDLRALGLMYLYTSKAAVDKCRFDQSLNGATSNMDQLIAADAEALLAFGDEEYDPQYDNLAFVRYAESLIAAQPPQSPTVPQQPVPPGPGPSSPSSSSSTATAADRDSALRAYALVLDAGVQLQMYKDKSFPATSYYLYDMDGDGIEELLVYGSMNDQKCEWSFRVLTYKAGAVWEIADSVNTCDFSHWWNVSSKIAFLDSGELYAYVWKSTTGINNGSISAIAYDGTYTSVRDASQVDTSNLFFIVDNSDDNGIRIHSPEDFLQGYLPAATPAPTPVPTPAPATPTPAVITPSPIPSGVVPPHETLDKPVYYGTLWRVNPYDAGWVCEIALYTWEYFDDSYVRSLSVGDHVTFGGESLEITEIRDDYIEVEHGLYFAPVNGQNGLWEICEPSGLNYTYPIGTARLLLPFGTPIVNDVNLEGIHVSDPQELIDQNGEGVFVYLEGTSEYITYLESMYLP